MDGADRIEAYLNEIRLGLAAVVILLIVIAYALFSR